MSKVISFIVATLNIDIGNALNKQYVHDPITSHEQCELYKSAIVNGYYEGMANAECMDFTPCETEHSESQCYWDATKRGNGKGESFVVIPSKINPGEFETHYVHIPPLSNR